MILFLQDDALAKASECPLPHRCYVVICSTAATVRAQGLAPLFFALAYGDRFVKRRELCDFDNDIETSVSISWR